MLSLPDLLKTKKMCTKAALINVCLLNFLAYLLKIRGMCAWEVLMNPCFIELVSDRLKMLKMRNNVVRSEDPYSV